MAAVYRSAAKEATTRWRVCAGWIVVIDTAPSFPQRRQLSTLQAAAGVPDQGIQHGHTERRR
ncbi:MAG: hypothetical protein O2977_05575 [Cyanobacteria bacterium]|jgi:hypothetical protein|nr:hypothetical protein [Cyanobacteriota bacterium]MDA1205652.1 hypothetical protein [Cyanobacteriota bacterium]